MEAGIRTVTAYLGFRTLTYHAFYAVIPSNHNRNNRLMIPKTLASYNYIFISLKYSCLSTQLFVALIFFVLSLLELYN